MQTAEVNSREIFPLQWESDRPVGKMPYAPCMTFEILGIYTEILVRLPSYYVLYKQKTNNNKEMYSTNFFLSNLGQGFSILSKICLKVAGFRKTNRNVC